MKFTLEIKLGNEAMRTYGDIASALIRTRTIIRSMDTSEDVVVKQTERIRDCNGNTAGQWKVREG